MIPQKKRGEVWVSAVLFMAVTVIVLSIILAATLPLVQKLKSRNIVAETKILLTALDENIRTVAREGPGSQREVPFTLNEGKLYINQDQNTMVWIMTIGDKLIEPGYAIPEGRLTLYLSETPVKSRYMLNITTDYTTIADLTLNSQYQNPFVGRYTAVIRHTGNYTSQSLPMVEVSVL